MKFLGALWTFLALLFASGFALFYHIFMITSYDRQGYEKLNAPQEATSEFSTKQLRQGIRKTLLLAQNEERKIGVLKADTSLFLFEKEEGSKGLVEEMENVQLVYQEELLEDGGTQTAARLIAKKALYDYEQERLTAHKGTLSRYRLLGHHFPEEEELKDPFFLCSAEEMDVDFPKKILKVQKLTGNCFSAHEARFENGEFFAGGGFHYEHPLGCLQAKSARGYFEQPDKTPREILLEEGVQVHLRDGSHIYSPFSRLDSTTWTANFHGLTENKVVLERPSQSLYLKSLEMTVKFLPPTLAQPAHIDHLIALNEVEIGLKEGFKLQGQKAHFHTFNSEGRFSKALLTDNCLLTKENEMEIYAEEIAADFDQEFATLKGAHGTLQTLKFDARCVRIDRKNGKIFLDPPVTLKMQDDSGLEHILKTSGAILLDPEARRTCIASNGKQIHFSNLWGDIFADQMQVYFEEVEGKLKPLKFSLEGNIRVQNIDAGLERYALAENADYDIASGELTLKAKRPARVLFYDLANKMQASAPELILKRNPETKKDEIKGRGNVRFLLAEDEWNELKKRFSFE